jgi:hypothetical protein
VLGLWLGRGVGDEGWEEQRGTARRGWEMDMGGKE